jgi:SNF2 family DNA or RNA helicase
MKSRVVRLFKRIPDPWDGEGELFLPEFTEVDRILDRMVHIDGSVWYLVKWCALPYTASTWEKSEIFKDNAHIDQWKQHAAFPTRLNVHDKKPPLSQWKLLEKDEPYKNGNRLRPWQVEGISWLLFNWYGGKNSILADEMVNYMKNHLNFAAMC